MNDDQNLKNAKAPTDVVSENSEPVVKDEANEPSAEEKTVEPVVEDASANAGKGKWYIIHTYSGHENKVAKSLKQRVESMGFENRVFEVIVPTRNTVKVAGGKTKNVIEKIFPGYLLVRMELDAESWILARTTQGVTAVIGAGNKPTPIPPKQVESIQKLMKTE